MKKQKLFLSIALAGVLLFSGCASFPQMTEEQEEAIVEYAAGLLIKNVKDYDSRLVDLSLYTDPEIMPEETPQPENGGMDETADTEKVDVSEGELYGSIDSLLVPEGVTLTYTGSSVVDTYPEDDDSEPFFALDATEGNKLLVLRFNMTNTTGEDQIINVSELSPKCIVIVNDTEKKHALQTMLLDDLRTYEGTLAAGEEVSLVLVAEMESAVLEHIENIKMKVTTENGSVTTLLQ